MCCGIISNERGAVSRLLVFAIIAGALGYGYYYFQGTPRYTLIQFKKSVVFSDGPGAEKCVDMDSFLENLPQQMKQSGDKEAIRRRVLYEIDSPHEKSTFATVKSWDTITVPIEIVDKVATVEQGDGAIITLEKVSERQWLITSVQFKIQEPPK